MKTALLIGGDSPEREVSLISGAAVGDALQSLGEMPLILDPLTNKDWLHTLLTHNIERVFNILHGGSGENGEVRGALNSVGIACTGSGVLGSALAMDKHVTKQIWQHINVPTADWYLANSAADAEIILNTLPLPLFVKPALGGSSTHSCVVRAAAALPDAITQALSESGGAMVEQYITGEEYTLSVVDDAPLPLIHISTARDFYDFNAKYVEEETKFVCPCDLPAATIQQLTETGMRAFHGVRCSHWGRVDFILAADGSPYFLEVNTVPGMTSHSLVPQAAAATGVSFDVLVGKLLAGAW